jgi:hypothetical protein
MRVELVYFGGCPNVAPMRELLCRCLAECGVSQSIVDVNTDDPATPAHYRRFASPTVLVDEVDVLAGTMSDAAACRLELPNESELIAAIRKHSASP